MAFMPVAYCVDSQEGKLPQWSIHCVESLDFDAYEQDNWISS
jgi:hypothetical protein